MCGQGVGVVAIPGPDKPHERKISDSRIEGQQSIRVQQDETERTTLVSGDFNYGEVGTIDEQSYLKRMWLRIKLW